MQHVSADALGMRWATYCIFYLYPVYALGCVVAALALWQAGTTGFQFMSILCGLAALAFGLGAGEVRSGTTGGWWMNWWLTGLVFITNAAVAAALALHGQSTEGTNQIIFAATMPLWFLWPSLVYWKRRACLFREFPDKPLRTQWVWLPAGMWLVLVAGIGLAILTPLVHEYSARETAASNLRPESTRPAAPPPQAIINPDADAPTPPIFVDRFQQWHADVAAFVSTRCELHSTSESARAQVAENVRLFQFAINEMDQAGNGRLSNTDLLIAAGERVYAYPGYTPRGHCPN